MKKAMLLCFVFTFICLTVVSCTPENITNNGQPSATADSIDPDEKCPPTDKNCNGIPDNEE